MFNLLDLVIPPFAYIISIFGDFAVPLLIIGVVLMVTIIIAFSVAHNKKKAKCKKIDKENEDNQNAK